MGLKRVWWVIFEQQLLCWCSRRKWNPCVTPCRNHSLKPQRSISQPELCELPASFGARADLKLKADMAAATAKQAPAGSQVSNTQRAALRNAPQQLFQTIPVNMIRPNGLISHEIPVGWTPWSTSRCCRLKSRTSSGAVWGWSSPENQARKFTWDLHVGFCDLSIMWRSCAQAAVLPSLPLIPLAISSELLTECPGYSFSREFLFCLSSSATKIYNFFVYKMHLTFPWPPKNLVPF